MQQENAFRKWLVCDPRSSVDEVAYQAVSNRLMPLPDLLRHAALKADDDIEHVHRLRVATRRAGAAVKAFAPFLHKKRRKRILKMISSTRHAAGRARDLDVLMNRHRGESRLLKRLAKKRNKSQRRIVKAYRGLVETDKLKNGIVSLLRSIPTSAPAPLFQGWACDQLQARVDALSADWPPDTSDLEALHQLRITAKALRYTIEFVSSAFDHSLRTDLYLIVESLQELLGEINDHHVALQKIDRWLESADTLDKEQLATLRSESCSALQASLNRFESEFGPTAKSKLEHDLRTLLEAV